MKTLPNVMSQGLRYGMVGLPAAATVQSVVTACGSCGGSVVNPIALLALMAGTALVIATGKKKK